MVFKGFGGFLKTWFNPVGISGEMSFVILDFRKDYKWGCYVII